MGFLVGADLPHPNTIKLASPPNTIRVKHGKSDVKKVATEFESCGGSIIKLDSYGHFGEIYAYNGHKIDPLLLKI